MLKKHRKIKGKCKYILKSLEIGEEIEGSHVSHMTNTCAYCGCAPIAPKNGHLHSMEYSRTRLSKQMYWAD